MVVASLTMPARKDSPAPKPVYAKAAPTRMPARSSPRPADAESLDVVRDLIVEVRDLREGLDRLKTEIEKLWARERLHSRAVAAATRTPRTPRKPGVRPGGRPSAGAPRPGAKGGKAKAKAKPAAKPVRRKPSAAAKSTKRSRAVKPRGRR